MKLLFASLLILAISSKSLKANSAECESCHIFIAALNKFAKDPKLVDKPAEIITKLCISKKGPAFVDICTGYVSEFRDLIQNTLVDRFIDPDFVCKDMGFCSGPQYVPENFTAYVEKVMKGKPPGPGPQPTGKKSFRFIHISDVHLDMYYKAGTLSVCEVPQCCRTGNGTEGNTAGQWGGEVCDLPIQTLYAALDQIKELEPEFILITGDFPPHDMWNQSKDYNTEYQKMVSTAFRSAFPNTPLYVIFGNHFCFPINQCPYAIGEYWLPKPFVEYWGLGEEVRLSLEEHAAYTVKHRFSNLRLMILDTNVFNDGSTYIMNNSTNPKGQLDWIYDQLLAAEKNNEQVYILGHMPTGDVNALPTWAKHFNILVDRFEYTIAGLFFGHSHNDEVHIHRGVYSNLPIKVQWVTPSFTTFTYRNPSFRLFTADQDSKQLLDYTQFRLNLTNANLYPDVKPIWDAVYSFKEFYGLDDISPQSVYELALLMGDNEQLSLKYLKNYNSGGKKAPSKCDHYCQHYNTCRMTYTDYDSIFACQGPTEDGLFYEMFALLFKEWTYLVRN